MILLDHASNNNVSLSRQRFFIEVHTSRDLFSFEAEIGENDRKWEL